MRLPSHPGRGGRNQSLALSAALVLKGRKNLWLLSAGTDGSDGPTEDAGALVDGETVARGKIRARRGCDAGESRCRNVSRGERRFDSHRTDGHERHGPDIRIKKKIDRIHRINRIKAKDFHLRDF